jgi:hypothetical protein
MMRLLVALITVVLFALPLLSASVTPVMAIGLVGVGLAVVGIAILWPWFVTAAACVFLVEYAAALWLAAAPVNIAVALVFGVGLVLLLHAAELARRVRRATVNAAVIYAQIVRWIGFGGGVFATAILAMALAGRLAASMPFVAAPFLAAAGALGVVLALAALLIRAARTDLSGRRLPASPSTK